MGRDGAVSKQSFTCPSSVCDDNALLLGVIGSNGRVGYVTPPLQVDHSFIDAVAATGGHAERRFRFAGTCVEGRCAQWTGNKCGAIEIALSTYAEVDSDLGLPACGIRNTCRWFAQSGRAACSVCPLVITNVVTDKGESTAQKAESER